MLQHIRLTHHGSVGTCPQGSFSFAFMRIEKTPTWSVRVHSNWHMVWFKVELAWFNHSKRAWIHFAERLEVETWTGQSSQNSRPKTEEQPLKEMTKSLVQRHSRNSYDSDMAEPELATPSSKPSWGCAGGSQSWVLKRFHCMLPIFSMLQCFYGWEWCILWPLMWWSRSSQHCFKTATIHIFQSKPSRLGGHQSMLGSLYQPQMSSCSSDVK